MAPRQITDMIAQRASRTVATAALALGLIATAFAPSSALAAPAQAAGLPDYGVKFTEGTLNVSQGHSFQATAVAQNFTNTKGGAVLTVLSPDEMGKPVIVNHGALVCLTQHSIGFISGWMVTCAETDIPGFDALTLRLTAPDVAGTYRLIATIKPGEGADANDSNNSAQETIHSQITGVPRGL